MPIIQVYLSDDDFVKYVPKKEDIQEKIRNLIKKEVAK